MKILKTFLSPFIPLLAAVAVVLTLHYITRVDIESWRFWKTWFVLTGIYWLIRYTK